MGEEASFNTVSMMEAAASNNGMQQQAKENGRASAAVVAADAVAAAHAVAATPVIFDPRLQGISDAIRVVPHFPKPGPPIHSFASQYQFNCRFKALMFARHVLVVQASCSTTSRRCSSGRRCSRTPWTSSWSTTAACPSTPSPVTTTSPSSPFLSTLDLVLATCSRPSLEVAVARACRRGAEF
jgi:hypothetical protein